MDLRRYTVIFSCNIMQNGKTVGECIRIRC